MPTEREAILIEALKQIANPKTLGNSAYCDCVHDTEDCCAKVGYYCPSCIAGKALRELGEDPYAD
jgi:hypothetical protein